MQICRLPGPIDSMGGVIETDRKKELPIGPILVLDEFSFPPK